MTAGDAVTAGEAVTAGIAVTAGVAIFGTGAPASASIASEVAVAGVAVVAVMTGVTTGATLDATPPEPSPLALDRDGAAEPVGPRSSATTITTTDAESTPTTMRMARRRAAGVAVRRRASFDASPSSALPTGGTDTYESPPSGATSFRMLGGSCSALCTPESVVDVRPVARRSAMPCSVASA